MQLYAFFDSPLAEQFAAVLLHFVWQGAVIAAIVAVVNFCWCKSASVQYLISVVGLAVMAVCPLATWVALSAGQELAFTSRVETVAFTTSKIPHEPPVAVASDLTEGETPVPSDLQKPYFAELTPWLCAAWLIGVALCATRLCLAASGVAWLRYRGCPAPGAILSTVQSLSSRMGRSAPVVLVSSHVSQALVAGLWRPFVLLPSAWLTELPPQALEAILAHELAHLRRRDLWVNTLQRLIEATLFYHPGVWWLSGHIRSLREMCCDELAVTATGSRLEYVKSLALVAQRRGGASVPVPSLAAAIGGSNMHLLNRVRNVLGLSPQGKTLPWWTLVAVLMAAGGAVWGIATATSYVYAEDGEAKEQRQRDGDRDRETEGDRDRPRDGERDRPTRREPPREGDRAPERDRPREGDRPRDGDRPREGGREEERERDGDRERPREGDRDRDRPRDGDFQREGERRLGGRRDGDRPSPEQIHRHLEELRRHHAELSEQGKHDAAREVEQKARALESQLRGERHGGEHRVGDRHPPEQFRRHIEELKRKAHELAEQGREEQADEINRHVRELIGEWERRPRESSGHRGDRPDMAPRDRELIEVIQQLRAEVHQLRRDVNQLRGERRFDGERDRHDFEAHPPLNRDRERHDNDRNEGERREPRRDRDEDARD